MAVYVTPGCERAGGKPSGTEGDESGKHEYCLLALEHLLERAYAYNAAGESVRWGWCRSVPSLGHVRSAFIRVKCP